MLFQLTDTSKDDVAKLLAFAKQNQLQLTLVDDAEDNLFLPGKPLSPTHLSPMIEKSRKSGMISIENAHEVIRNAYNAG